MTGVSYPPFSLIAAQTLPGKLASDILVKDECFMEENEAAIKKEESKILAALSEDRTGFRLPGVMVFNLERKT